MRRFLLLAFTLLTGCLGVRPGDVQWTYEVPEHLSNPDSALTHLALANVFMTYVAGRAFDPAYQGAAFRTLVHSPDAPALFTRLLSEGSPEGRLYGLAGLWLADSLAYRAALPSYLSQADTVEVMYGCLRHARMAHEAVADIEAGWLVADLAGRSLLPPTP